MNIVGSVRGRCWSRPLPCMRKLVLLALVRVVGGRGQHHRPTATLGGEATFALANVGLGTSALADPTGHEPGVPLFTPRDDEDGPAGQQLRGRHRLGVSVRVLAS